MKKWSEMTELEQWRLMESRQPFCKCEYNFTCGHCLRGGSIITNPEDPGKLDHSNCK